MSATNETATIRRYLNRWPEELQPVVALALSVAHWSPAAREGYNDKGVAIAGRDANCGHYPHHLCALCVQHALYMFNACVRCPLYRAGYGCDDIKAVDRIWQRLHETISHGPWDTVGDGSFHAVADEMYNVLVELYRVEWEKL